MKTTATLCAGLLALVLMAPPARAVINNGSNGVNTTAPTGGLSNSGWSYEGQWRVGGGTVVGSNYVLTAKHLAGSVGKTFTYDGNPYTVTQIYDQPGTDLRILQTQQTFSSWAPLYAQTNEAGKDFVVFGYGVTRGAAANNPMNPAQQDGWLWNDTPTAGNKTWGTGSIDQATTLTIGSNNNAPVLKINFTAPTANGPNATPAEGDSSALADRDSGGGLFINDGGTWKLAGVIWATSGPFYASASDAINNVNPIDAALYDGSGYYERGFDTNTNTYVALPADPTAGYVSRISSNRAWIDGILNQPIPSPATLWVVLVGLPMLVLPRRHGR
ncbi:MAG: hypothetical protein GC164_14515 [Phycisphaera sp.]|nr:hypothetical protein [Phycisphaera sp.]